MSTQRELIASALRKLGPERCASGLAAFADPNPRDFTGCFLARAYGERGEWERDAWTGVASFPELLGITYSEMRAVYQAFDSIDATTVCPAELYDMAQAEAAKAHVVRHVQVAV